MSLQYIYPSSVGPMYFVASEQGLQGLFWNKQQAPVVKTLEGNEGPVLILKKALRQVEEFLEGKRRHFDLVYDIGGTDFQKKVWQELARIPYGETVSYTHIAKKIKQAKAVRAVGTANGRNPLSIIVPCHRVIAADGTLGGYAGGLEVKTKLLELEQRSK